MEIIIPEWHKIKKGQIYKVNCSCSCIIKHEGWVKSLRNNNCSHFYGLVLYSNNVGYIGKKEKYTSDHILVELTDDEKIKYL